MTICSHNINDTVRFKLTELGREVLISKGRTCYYSDWSLVEGEWVQTQLWVFTRFAARQMDMGCPPVIEENTLYFV